MRQREVETLAARHVPGAGELDIHRLGSGLINETYRVSRDGAVYVLRLPLRHLHELGVDREWEARVLERAVAAGLASAVEFCDAQRGILISRWVEGRFWTAADVRRPSNIHAIAALMRRVHALPIPVPARPMSPSNWIDHYRAALVRTDSVPQLEEEDAASGVSAALAKPNRSDVGAASDAANLAAAAAVQLRKLAELPGVSPVLCHSDLHTLNLIDSGRELVPLDWEYAHVSDPFWDLAGWIANNDLENEARHALLTNYAARPPSGEEWSRLGLLCWLYDYVCLLWSALYLKLRGRAGQAAGDGVPRRARLLAARLHAGLTSA